MAEAERGQNPTHRDTPGENQEQGLRKVGHVAFKPKEPLRISPERPFLIGVCVSPCGEIVGRKPGTSPMGAAIPGFPPCGDTLYAKSRKPRKAKLSPRERNDRSGILRAVISWVIRRFGQAFAPTEVVPLYTSFANKNRLQNHLSLNLSAFFAFSSNRPSTVRYFYQGHSFRFSFQALKFSPRLRCPGNIAMKALSSEPT